MPMLDYPRYLYRGFDPTRYEETSGGLAPKEPGEPFQYVFRAGEIMNKCSGQVLQAGAGAVAGLSDVNAVLRHQSDPDLGWRDCGISTTPSRSRGEHYAKHGGTRPRGSVLVIDTALLAQHQVRCYRVSEYVTRPSIPEDDEYILVARDFKTLPDGIVVERYAV